MPLLGAALSKPGSAQLLMLMRNRIGGDEDRFLPQILKQERLKPRTISQDFIPLRPLIPIQREIRINHAHTVIYDFVRLRQIIPAGILNNRTAAAQFCELSDEPGQGVLIGRLIADRDVDLNADSWSEARQGASSSIRRYSSTACETPRRRFPPSEASSYF
jgi:hypothetical protein